MRRALAASFLVTLSTACAKPTQNPPAPDPTPSVTPKAKPKPEPTVEKKSGPFIKVKNKECVEYYPDNCPEGAKCNPPEPRVIDCPVERVKKLADGTCTYRMVVDCAPDEDCNPPAPMPVKCPPGAK